MSERESKLLADWLQSRLEGGNPDLPPPAGLDAEVVEAVDALRPDLVPLPADGLTAALSKLVDGPLALEPSGPEVEEARRLAEALAASEPVDPEALGPEAYTALAALRPSALPVPSLDATDLAGPVPSPEERVRSHLDQTGSTPEASSPLPPSAVAPASAPAPANQRRWVLPGLSAVAMVAAVLVVVLPAGPGLMQQESPFSAPVEALDEAVPAPMAEAEAFEEEVAADTPFVSPRASAPPPGRSHRRRRRLLDRRPSPPQRRCLQTGQRLEPAPPLLQRRRRRLHPSDPTQRRVRPPRTPSQGFWEPGDLRPRLLRATALQPTHLQTMLPPRRWMWGN